MTTITVSLKKACILTLVIIMSISCPSMAFAAKKKSDPAAEAAAAAAKAAAEAEAAKKKEEAEILKATTQVNKNLTDLMRKYQARQLFSPEDAGKLSDIKFQLIDLTNKYPTSDLLAKPVYQAGFLLAERGQYDDAYELLTFLTTQNSPSPYTMKAKVCLYQMQKELGKDYFDAMAAAVGASTPTKTPTTSTPPKTPSDKK